MTPDLQALRIRAAERMGIAVCTGCLNAVDPEVCHCGDGPKSHGLETGHGFIPQGCMCGYLDDKYREKKWRGVPDYTGSTDAAMTLVEKCKYLGWHWFDLSIGPNGYWLATFDDNINPKVIRDADTPALAITLAALAVLEAGR